MGELADDLGGDVGVDHGPAMVGDFDGLGQLRHAAALEQIPAGAVFQGAEHILVVVEGGQDNDAGLGVALLDEPGGLHPCVDEV